MDNFKEAFKFLESKVKSNTIKPKTLKVYQGQLNELNRNLHLDENVIDLDHYKKHAKQIVEMYDKQNASQQNGFKTLLMFYKILHKELPKEFDRLLHKLKDQTNIVKSQAPKKKLPFTNFEQVKEIQREMRKEITKKSSYNDIVKFITLSFYTLIPPARPDEILSLKLIKSIDDYDKDEQEQLKKMNYFDIKAKKMYYSQYKTKRTYGDIELPVPDELVSIVKEFYPVIKYANDDFKYPITRSSGQPIGVSNFPLFFKSIIELKGATATDLRNLFVSSLKDVSAEQRAIIAKYMKNSLSAQNIVYSKYNNTLYPTNIEMKDEGYYSNDDKDDHDSDSSADTYEYDSDFEEEKKRLEQEHNEIEKERENLRLERERLEEEKSKLNKPKRKYTRKAVKSN